MYNISHRYSAQRFRCVCRNGRVPFAFYIPYRVCSGRNIDLHVGLCITSTQRQRCIEVEEIRFEYRCSYG